MNKKDQKIIFCGNLHDCGGYSYLNRSYMRGLIDRGWNVGAEAINGTRETSDEEQKFFDSLRRYNADGKAMPYLDPDLIKIVSFLPLVNIPKFKHNVIYTMMESLKVNPTFVNNCNRFYNSCWTPTNYNANVFKEAGLSIPVKVLPIGIDDMYQHENSIDNFFLNYQSFPQNAPMEPQGFKFISVFRWSFRKGFDVLIKSYLREFKKKDNVSLILISRHAAMSHDKRFEEAIERDILNLIDKYGHIDSPPIYWCKDIMPMDFMPSMYRIGDCFVSTSRGEGFGIPMLEASKMGLPCILPNHTGFTDYATNENCFRYDVDRWVVCNDVPEWNGWVTRDFSGQEFPLFGEDTVNEVSYLMRFVMDNPEMAKKRNEKLNEVIRTRYSWDVLIDKCEEYLNDIITNI